MISPVALAEEAHAVTRLWCETRKWVMGTRDFEIECFMSPCRGSVLVRRLFAVPPADSRSRSGMTGSHSSKRCVCHVDEVDHRLFQTALDCEEQHSPRHRLRPRAMDQEKFKYDNVTQSAPLPLSVTTSSPLAVSGQLHRISIYFVSGNTEILSLMYCHVISTPGNNIQQIEAESESGRYWLVADSIGSCPSRLCSPIAAQLRGV